MNQTLSLGTIQASIQSLADPRRERMANTASHLLQMCLESIEVCFILIAPNLLYIFSGKFWSDDGDARMVTCLCACPNTQPQFVP